MNPGHFLMSIARVPIDDLLNSVGAVFAHLLLSGTTGVAIGESDNLPQGYVSNIDLDDLDDAPRITDDLHTRLIQSHGGGLFVPFHRTKFRIPWCKIARSPIENGRSQRQLFQSLAFAGGVPTPLRGLHAWLAYFRHGVADHGIRNDPYGVLRYGETLTLPLRHGSLLFRCLTQLAEQDPLFRSKDWRRGAVVGLARMELKTQFVNLIKNPDRRLHLSMLVLEALARTNLVDEIRPELMAHICSSESNYLERAAAARALVVSRLDVDCRLQFKNSERREAPRTRD